MSTTLKASPLLTVEDYLLTPDDGPRYQLIEGQLYVAPSPNRFHQVVSRNLEYLLLDYLDDHPIGELYHAPFDVYLDKHNVFQPDIVVFLNERRSFLSDRGAEGAPDFVVEILSPSTTRLDRDKKLRIYAQHGVRELWLIEPNKRQIEVYLLGESIAEAADVHHGNDIIVSPLFPDLKFDAARIFAR